MSKRGQQNSSKRNKHKSQQSVSITDKSLFAKDLMLDREDNSISLQSASSSSSTLHPSSGSSQLHQRKPARAAERLEDIDQDDDNQDDDEEEESRGNRHTSKQTLNKKSTSVANASVNTSITATSTARNAFSKLTSLSSWVSNSREQEATGLWSWLTSSRTISQAQQRQEDRDDALRLARHQLDLQTRFSITFNSNSREQKSTSKKKKTEEADNATEREKEAMKSLWDSSKKVEAFNLKRQDWVALFALTIVTLGVRFWRISWPDEVVLDETNVGQLVNGYAKGEFVLDAHPPLGKMILAGISSMSNYSGGFGFEDIGDQYPGSVPYVSMRGAMATMGALCVPMAYATLKASGHGAPAAILASTLVAFDNALTASNRMMALDAPLMFFTAATIMSWNFFIKQSARPFTRLWWTWLLATGVSMTGAMSIKLIGTASALTALYFMSLNLWTLARDKAVSTSTWLKHCTARMGALVVLPVALYLILFQLHFANETHQPDYRISPRAESDLDHLSRLYRQSLISHYPTEDHIQTWRDVVYGSVVQIQSEAKPHAGSVGNVYIHSSAETNPKGTQQQLVSGYSYPDINTQWIIIKADVDSDDGEPEEIPSRMELVKNGDLVRLRHVSTRKCLHSHNHRTYTNAQNDKFNEVTGYGGHGFDGDSNDWWVIETVDSETLREGTKSASEPIRALESTFRIRHYEIGCYLFASDSPLPEPWGAGRTEVICRNDARVTDKSVWRFAHNRHDYLPKDTPKTKYPTPSFWAKFTEMHQLMWSYKGPLEENLQISSSNPRHWPMGQAMIQAWSGYQRQIAIVANPVVWWTATLGLVTYVFSAAVFAIRQKRGYFETGRLGEFQRFHLSEAGTFFTGWASHYLPFFFVDRVLYMHHYFPSLYFSILLFSSILPGILGFLSRPVRFAAFTALLLLTIATFLRLAPLSYGSEMSREKCEAISRWVNPKKGYFSNELDCSLAPWAAETPKPLWILRQQGKVDKALSKTERQVTMTIKDAKSPTGTTTMVAASNFMTAEPVILLGDTAASPSAPFFNGKGSRLSVTKPLPKIRAPVLPMQLPPIKRRLPVPDIVLLPYQQPPQLWDRETQALMMQREDLNLYEKLQIQQLVSGNYQKVNNDEDDESSDEEEEVVVVDSVNGPEQDQNQNQNQNQDGDVREDSFGQQDEGHLDANNNNQAPSPDQLSVEPLKRDSSAADADAEIDRVLSRFQERNRQAAVLAAAAYHQIRIPDEQLQIEDDEAEQLDYNPADIFDRRFEQLGNNLADSGNGNSNDTEHNRDQQIKNYHTLGLAQPAKFEGGKSFKRRQMMMDAAVVAAKKQEQEANQASGKDGKAEGKGARAFLGAAKNLEEELQELREQAVEQKVKLSILQEKRRLAREARIERNFQKRKDSQKVCGAILGNAAAIRKQIEEEDDAAVAAGLYDDGDEDDLRNDWGRGVARQWRAEFDARQKMTQEEKDILEKAKESKAAKNREAKEARERAAAERKRIRLLAKAEAEAAAAAAAAAEDEDKGEEEEGVVDENDESDSADRAQISESSSEEGYQLLQQQEDDAYYGDDYDFNDNEEEQEYEMRGPPISVGSAEELEQVLRQLQEEGVRAEVVRGAVTETIEAIAPAASAAVDDGNNEDDNEGERPPPIAVKNAEELASVLEKLAADGVRAEVVQGDLTRYVEPPMASV
ncbi:hypothetical protein EC991_007188 [Linnemannia zychae]|nr:hypothetical protein EC991_007188 [Linnemannia zychae]